MELKGKSLYGVAALIAGVAALIFAGVYWLLQQKIDSTVQAALALGLILIAVAAWLELDLITRFLKTRQAKYGAETLGLVILFVIVVVLINYIFTREKLKQEWDLTASQENSLAPETLKALSDLKEPVKVMAFYTSGSYSRQSGEDLLKKFRDKGNGNFGYELIDPESKPLIAQQYGVTTDGTLVITKGGQHENVKFASESEIVNALVRLENPIELTIYFIAGHGEFSPDTTDNNGFSSAKTDLQNINYQVKTLDSLANAVPVDAAVMVIAGPTKPYSQAEVDNLAKYLAGGGKVIFMVETSLLGGIEKGQTDPLVDYLSKTWGITLRDDVVVDSAQYMQSLGPTVPVTSSYGTSPIISDDMKNVFSFFVAPRSIDLAATPPDGVTLNSVVKTSPSAFGETNLDALQGVEGQQVQINPEDAQGELTLVATGENATTKGRVVVIGDAEFAVNGYWSSQIANPNIFLNAIKWTSKRTDLISLSPKPTSDTTMTVTSRDVIVIFLLGCLLPPILIVVAGVSVWWSRRKG
jgi:ABC-type uncharacterized transport system involved in gliding motility auxiliary subunit